MNPHDLLLSDHATLRKQAATLRETIERGPEKMSGALGDFQIAVQKHFKREDTYYRILDDGKRVEDRELIHQLRNDHAGVIFTLESLVIRLRKFGLNADWRARFDNLMKVFLPHLDQEDSVLFPLGQKLLTPQELAAILKDLQSVE